MRRGAWRLRPGHDPRLRNRTLQATKSAPAKEVPVEIQAKAQGIGASGRLLDWMPSRPDPSMKSAGIALLAALALVAGLVLWQMLRPEPLPPPSATHVRLETERLYAEAGRSPPSLPSREAMNQAAVRRTKEAMARGGDGTRAGYAAGIFYGAYLANTRARPAWCRRHGVDLTPFAKAYEAAHREELAQALAIFAAAGLNPEQFTRVDAQLAELVEQDMRDLGRDTHLQPRQACALYNEKASEFARAITLPPEVHQALFSAR